MFIVNAYDGDMERLKNDLDKMRYVQTATRLASDVMSSVGDLSTVFKQGDTDNPTATVSADDGTVAKPTPRHESPVFDEEKASLHALRERKAAAAAAASTAPAELDADEHEDERSFSMPSSRPAVKARIAAREEQMRGIAKGLAATEHDSVFGPVHPHPDRLAPLDESDIIKQMEVDERAHAFRRNVPAPEPIDLFTCHPQNSASPPGAANYAFIGSLINRGLITVQEDEVTGRCYFYDGDYLDTAKVTRRHLRVKSPRMLDIVLSNTLRTGDPMVVFKQPLLKQCGGSGIHIYDDTMRTYRALNTTANAFTALTIDFIEVPQDIGGLASNGLVREKMVRASLPGKLADAFGATGKWSILAPPEYGFVTPERPFARLCHKHCLTGHIDQKCIDCWNPVGYPDYNRLGASVAERLRRYKFAATDHVGTKSSIGVSYYNLYRAINLAIKAMGAYLIYWGISKMIENVTDPVDKPPTGLPPSAPLPELPRPPGAPVDQVLESKTVSRQPARWMIKDIRNLGQGPYRCHHKLCKTPAKCTKKTDLLAALSALSRSKESDSDDQYSDAGRMVSIRFKGRQFDVSTSDLDSFIDYYESGVDDPHNFDQDDKLGYAMYHIYDELHSLTDAENVADYRGAIDSLAEVWRHGGEDFVRVAIGTTCSKRAGKDILDSVVSKARGHRLRTESLLRKPTAETKESDVDYGMVAAMAAGTGVGLAIRAYRNRQVVPIESLEPSVKKEAHTEDTTNRVKLDGLKSLGQLRVPHGRACACCNGTKAERGQAALVDMTPVSSTVRFQPLFVTALHVIEPQGYAGLRVILVVNKEEYECQVVWRDELNDLAALKAPPRAIVGMKPLRMGIPRDGAEVYAYRTDGDDVSTVYHGYVHRNGTTSEACYTMPTIPGMSGGPVMSCADDTLLYIHIGALPVATEGPDRGLKLNVGCCITALKATSKASQGCTYHVPRPFEIDDPAYQAEVAETLKCYDVPAKLRTTSPFIYRRSGPPFKERRPCEYYTSFLATGATPTAVTPGREHKANVTDDFNVRTAVDKFSRVGHHHPDERCWDQAVRFASEWLHTCVPVAVPQFEHEEVIASIDGSTNPGFPLEAEYPTKKAYYESAAFPKELAEYEAHLAREGPPRPKFLAINKKSGEVLLATKASKARVIFADHAVRVYVTKKLMGSTFDRFVHSHHLTLAGVAGTQVTRSTSMLGAPIFQGTFAKMAALSEGAKCHELDGSAWETTMSYHAMMTMGRLMSDVARHSDRERVMFLNLVHELATCYAVSPEGHVIDRSRPGGTNPSGNALTSWFSIIWNFITTTYGALRQQWHPTLASLQRSLGAFMNGDDNNVRDMSGMFDTTAFRIDNFNAFGIHYTCSPQEGLPMTSLRFFNMTWHKSRRGWVPRSDADKVLSTISYAKDSKQTVIERVNSLIMYAYGWADQPGSIYYHLREYRDWLDPTGVLPCLNTSQLEALYHNDRNSSFYPLTVDQYLSYRREDLHLLGRSVRPSVHRGTDPAVFSVQSPTTCSPPVTALAAALLASTASATTTAQTSGGSANTPHATSGESKRTRNGRGGCAPPVACLVEPPAPLSTTQHPSSRTPAAQPTPSRASVRGLVYNGTPPCEGCFRRELRRSALSPRRLRSQLANGGQLAPCPGAHVQRQSAAAPHPSPSDPAAAALSSRCPPGAMTWWFTVVTDSTPSSSTPLSTASVTSTMAAPSSSKCQSNPSGLVSAFDGSPAVLRPLPSSRPVSPTAPPSARPPQATSSDSLTRTQTTPSILVSYRSRKPPHTLVPAAPRFGRTTPGTCHRARVARTTSARRAAPQPTSASSSKARSASSSTFRWIAPQSPMIRTTTSAVCTSTTSCICASQPSSRISSAPAPSFAGLRKTASPWALGHPSSSNCELLRCILQRTHAAMPAPSCQCSPASTHPLLSQPGCGLSPSI